MRCSSVNLVRLWNQQYFISYVLRRLNLDEAHNIFNVYVITVIMLSPSFTQFASPCARESLRAHISCQISPCLLRLVYAVLTTTTALTRNVRNAARAKPETFSRHMAGKGGWKNDKIRCLGVRNRGIQRKRS